MAYAVTEHTELPWPGLGHRFKSGKCPWIRRRLPFPSRIFQPPSSGPRLGSLSCFSRSPKCRSRASAASCTGRDAGIVDQHHWMTADEFNETYALCHFLPGPNIVNLSMVFGSRIRGIAGGVAAFAGLLAPPTAIITILAALYARYGEIDALRRILAGVSCAAVGLLIATVLRMMTPLIKRRDAIGLVLLVAVLVAIGVARLPLQTVLLVAIPISLAVT